MQIDLIESRKKQMLFINYEKIIKKNTCKMNLTLKLIVCECVTVLNTQESQKKIIMNKIYMIQIFKIFTLQKVSLIFLLFFRIISKQSKEVLLQQQFAREL